MKTVKITKRNLLKILNGILEGTGCREICKICSTHKVGHRIYYERKFYGEGIGGCCSGCDYFEKGKGCKPTKQRSLICTVHICRILGKRLEEFNLAYWFRKMREAPIPYYGDIQSPYTKKLADIIVLRFGE